MTDENIEFPILDFTEDRLVDGDTRALVTKINNQQLKLETWSVGANALRQIQYDTTSLPLSGGTMIGKIYGPQTDLTDPANTVVTKSLVDYHAYRSVTTTQAQTIWGVKTFNSDIVFNGLVTINDALIKSAQELDVGSSIVVLNSDETGSPTVDAGIEIERGTHQNARLVWDEGTDRWQAGPVNDLKNIAVEGDYVNITTAQTVTGAKTFTSNTTFNGLSANNIFAADNSFVFLSSPIRVSSAAVASSTNDRDLITKGYVDTQITNSAFNGGSINNDLTIDSVIGGASLRLNATATAGNGNIFFERGGAQEAVIASQATNLLLRWENQSGGADTNVQLFDDYVNVNKEVRSSVLTTDADSGFALTTKSYVNGLDDQNVKITGNQDVNGIKTFKDNITIHNDTPVLFLRKNAETQQTAIRFLDESNTITGDIYVEPSPSRNLVLRKRTGTTLHSVLSLGDDVVRISGSVQSRSTVAGDVGTTLTTKDYVDSVAAGGSGSGSFVDTSSNQTIGGQKTFTSETVVQNPFLRVKDQSPWLSVIGTTPGHVGNQHLQFKSTDSNGDDNLSALIFQEGASNSFRIRKYNRENGTGIQTELIFYNSFIQSQDPIRLNATPEDRDDAVLRRIDADNRYALAGSTGSGGLSQDVHGTVNLPAKSSTQGSAIRLYESTGGGDDYVELGAHDNMTDHYRLQFPRLKPTANDQALVVESINAGVITLKWA